MVMVYCKMSIVN